MHQPVGVRIAGSSPTGASALFYGGGGAGCLLILRPYLKGEEMPLERFICPDKESIGVKDCLTKCRMAERCLTLPTLTLIAEEREWHGVPSTTQLLNGTMMEFLKLTKPYAVDPDRRMFMLAGTNHHKSLELAAKELGLPAEVALSIDRDIFDLLEEEDGELVMTDYKLWGSYAVAKALGIVKVGEQPDPSGEVYKSTGKWGKAGSPKMVPIFQRNASQADNADVELQQNRYRVKLAEKGIQLKRMQIQVIVRDGGLAIATSRGITRNSYRIPIKKIEDDVVTAFFAAKESALLSALAMGKWEQPCSEAECWEGKRCQDYCDVACYCPKGLLYITGGN